MAMLDNCKKADLYDDEGNLLYQCSVEQGPMGGLLLVASRDLDYQSQKDFLVVFYDPVMGMVTCRCTLSTPLNLPNHMLSLRCEVVEQLSQDQRRMDLKVPVGLKVMIHVPAHPGDTFYVPEKGYPATAENISAGGVYLRSDLPLQAGRQLWFDLNEIGGNSPTLTAYVLRVDTFESTFGKPTYGYGCYFTKLTSQQESQLRSYVFREERRLRKRESS